MDKLEFQKKIVEMEIFIGADGGGFCCDAIGEKFLSKREPLESFKKWLKPADELWL